MRCCLIFKLLILTLNILCFVITSNASQSTLGAISKGLGGAGVSSVDVGESYTINPASLAHLRGAVLTTGSSKTQTQFEKKNDLNSNKEGWYLSLNENGPDSTLATSLFYSQNHFIKKSDFLMNDASIKETNDLWVSVGNFVAPQISFGLSYRYHETEYGTKSAKEHNFTMGLLWSLSPNLGFGLSLQNFKKPSDNIPPLYTLSRSTNAGALYFYKDFLQFRIDFKRNTHIVLDEENYQEWSTGMETNMNPWMVTRIGLARQITDKNNMTDFYSFGLGFKGPRFGIHYAYQQARGTQTGAEHSIDLIIPL